MYITPLAGAGAAEAASWAPCAVSCPTGPWGSCRRRPPRGPSCSRPPGAHSRLNGEEDRGKKAREHACVLGSLIYLLGHKLLHVVLGEPVVAPFGPGHEGHRDLPDLRLHLFPATMTGRDTLRDLAHFPNDDWNTTTTKYCICRCIARTT